jgi:mono/diheme cytochrome c family protein
MKTHYLISVTSITLLLGVLAALIPVGRTTAAQGTTDMGRGQAVYNHWCTPCHAAGPGHPGTQSLEIKYNGSLPAVLEQRTDLTPEFVKTMVRKGILLMAPFRKTEITDTELDDLAAYLVQNK